MVTQDTAPGGRKQSLRFKGDPAADLVFTKCKLLLLSIFGGKHLIAL